MIFSGMHRAALDAERERIWTSSLHDGKQWCLSIVTAKVKVFSLFLLRMNQKVFPMRKMLQGLSFAAE